MRDLTRRSAGWLRLAGSLRGVARVQAAGAVTWAVTDIPWPMFSAAVAGPAAEMEAVDAALAELTATGLPWFWFVLRRTPAGVGARVAAAGATAFDERAPWMEAPRAALPRAERPPGVTLVECVDEPDVRVWGDTMQSTYVGGTAEIPATAAGGHRG